MCPLRPSRPACKAKRRGVTSCHLLRGEVPHWALLLHVLLLLHTLPLLHLLLLLLHLLLMLHLLLLLLLLHHHMMLLLLMLGMELLRDILLWLHRRGPRSGNRQRAAHSWRWRTQARSLQRASPLIGPQWWHQLRFRLRRRPLHGPALRMADAGVTAAVGRGGRAVVGRCNTCCGCSCFGGSLLRH